MLTISDKFTCPHCGGRFYLHEAAALPEALRLAKTANACGALWPDVLAYVECFQPISGRGLSLARVIALVDEVARMFVDKGFDYGRSRRRIDRDVLAAALKATTAAGKSGLKNHNYLKKVALDMQQKADNLRSVEQEKALRAKEERLKAGRREGGSGKGKVGSPAAAGLINDLAARMGI